MLLSIVVWLGVGGRGKNEQRYVYGNFIFHFLYDDSYNRKYDFSFHDVFYTAQGTLEFFENCAESEGFEDLDNCINLDESKRACEDIALFFDSDFPMLRSYAL